MSANADQLRAVLLSGIESKEAGEDEGEEIEESDSAKYSIKYSRNLVSKYEQEMARKRTAAESKEEDDVHASGPNAGRDEGTTHCWCVLCSLNSNEQYIATHHLLSFFEQGSRQGWQARGHGGDWASLRRAEHWTHLSRTIFTVFVGRKCVECGQLLGQRADEGCRCSLFDLFLRLFSPEVLSFASFS